MFTNKYRNRAKVNQEFNSLALGGDLRGREWTWKRKSFWTGLVPVGTIFEVHYFLYFFVWTIEIIKDVIFSK